MRWVLVVLAVGVLVGCGGGSRTAGGVCGWTRDVPEWDRCIAGYTESSYRRESEATAAARQREDIDAAGLLLMGVGAFLNGYNSGRSHAITCTSIGGITTCD